MVRYGTAAIVIKWFVVKLLPNVWNVQVSDTTKDATRTEFGVPNKFTNSKLSYG